MQQIIVKNINKFKTKIIVKENNIIYGHISYVNKDNIIHLTNLYVEEKYRKRGFGSMLLNKVEEVNKSCKFLDLCAWEPINKPRIVNFYKKNGYKIDNSNYGYYDDGVTTYDLISMTKQNKFTENKIFI